MGGSKSSSSTDQAQTTLSADGIVSGSVINLSSKGNVNFTQEFPDTVADAFKQLIELSNKSIDTAIGATEYALETSTNAALQAAQPDLTTLKQSLKYTPYLVIGIIAIAGAVVWRR